MLGYWVEEGADREGREGSYLQGYRIAVGHFWSLEYSQCLPLQTTSESSCGNTLPYWHLFCQSALTKCKEYCDKAKCHRTYLLGYRNTLVFVKDRKYYQAHICKFKERRRIRLTSVASNINTNKSYIRGSLWSWTNKYLLCWLTTLLPSSHLQCTHPGRRRVKGQVDFSCVFHSIIWKFALSYHKEILFSNRSSHYFTFLHLYIFTFYIFIFVYIILLKAVIRWIDTI